MQFLTCIQLFVLFSLEVFDHFICKLAGFHQGSVVHELVEVNGNAFACDGSTEAVYNNICRFFPAHVFQHHYTTEDNGARVHGICVGEAWSGTVGSFEYSITCRVVNVSAGSDTDTAYGSSESIGDVVTVQVKRSHYGVILWRQ